MKKQTSKNIIDHFKKLEDPCIDRTKLHNLIDIIVITICAVICGAKTWEAIELVGKEKYDWFTRFLELPNGNPTQDEVIQYFDYCFETNFKDVEYEYYKEIDTGHGRIEKRKYWLVTTLDWYSDKNLWKCISGIIMVKAEREIAGKKTSVLRYYIMSLSSDAKKVGDAVRSHWGIKNSLHWVLDIILPINWFS